ncbi:MAG TPA: 50S ribosomal protein L25 [Acidimicrobiia bacterium]|jgi:large subunit ribosomal protein L25
MATIETKLVATVREGRGNGPGRRVRALGQVPAVVYGLGVDNEAVAVNAHDLDKILHSVSGVNSVITLNVDGGKDQLVLTRQIQRNPVKGSLTHVDFIRVRADVAITAEVQLALVGEPEGVRGGGLLEQMLFSIAVSARPADVPTGLEYDVSALELGDQVHVRDITVPPGVEITNDPDDLVAQVSVPRGLAEEEAGEGAEGEGAEGEGTAAEGGAAAEASGESE